jgi:hypothetical protein
MGDIDVQLVVSEKHTRTCVFNYFSCLCTLQQAQVLPLRQMFHTLTFDHIQALYAQHVLTGPNGQVDGMGKSFMPALSGSLLVNIDTYYPLQAPSSGHCTHYCSSSVWARRFCISQSMQRCVWASISQLNDTVLLDMPCSSIQLVADYSLEWDLMSAPNADCAVDVDRDMLHESAASVSHYGTSFLPAFCHVIDINSILREGI